jgi:hypothetical protein
MWDGNLFGFPKLEASLDDRQVAVRLGLRIGAPGEALAWVRSLL